MAFDEFIEVYWYFGLFGWFMAKQQYPKPVDVISESQKQNWTCRHAKYNLFDMISGDLLSKCLNEAAAKLENLTL